MDFHKGQSEIFNDRHRFRVVNCGRRFGKTTLAVVEMVAKAVSKGGLIISYIAPTYQQARDISWNMLVKIADPVVKNKNETRLELTIKSQDGGTSTISLRGWENIETMRGMRNDLLILDEVSSYKNFINNWQEILRPTLTDTKGEALFVSTPKGFNHFYDIFNLESRDNDYKSFHFTSYDNPFLPVEELDKSRQELTEDRFAQEYLADFRKTEGLVYKEFDRKRHIFTNEMYNPIERMAGIDWGFTNPTSSHLYEKDSDRHYWVTQEYYHPGKTTLDVIEHVKSLRPDKVYPDPAEPDRNLEAKKAGLNIKEVSKDIEAGINCVRELLKQGRLHIHSSCVNLINEFETYSYPDKKPERNENEVPIKEHDHALDELRYVLYMNEGVPTKTHAVIYYPGSNSPRNNLNQFQDLKAPPVPNAPKVAYTHIPKLL